MSKSPSPGWSIGRVLVILAALLYGPLPSLIDLFTPQHLTNSDWIGHARFHLLWQIFLTGYIGLRAACRVLSVIASQRSHFDRIGLDLGYLYSEGRCWRTARPQ